MTSRVDICNLALSYLGIGSDALVANTSKDLNDQTEPARACLLSYDACRKQLLQVGTWSFARKITTLALVSDVEKIGQWSYQYAIPHDLIRITKLYNKAGFPLQRNTIFNEYDIFVNRENKFILACHLSNAELEYIFDQKETEKFSPLFVEALACRIAAKNALRLTKDIKKYQLLEVECETILNKALAEDLKQRYCKTPICSNYLKARK